PGLFDYGAYLRLHGIDEVASVRGVDAVSIEHAPATWSDFLSHPLRPVDRWRAQLREAGRQSLDPAHAGLFLGMVIGEADWVPADVRDRFMATGTVHLLSISGSHLGLIAVLIFTATSLGCRAMPESMLLRISRHLTPAQIAAIITAATVLLYTALAGAQ